MVGPQEGAVQIEGDQSERRSSNGWGRAVLLGIQRSLVDLVDMVSVGLCYGISHVMWGAKNGVAAVVHGLCFRFFSFGGGVSLWKKSGEWFVVGWAVVT
jgi:hypothetical protein